MSLYDYINKKNWEMKSNIVNNRKAGLIHRKDWEWALGIIAMRRFGKLNKRCTAIGVGAGREEVLFYLDNSTKKFSFQWSRLRKYNVDMCVYSSFDFTIKEYTLFIDQLLLL